MDNNILEHLDQQRWLMNNGLLTPAAQDNIYAYGYICHPKVSNVLVTVDSIGKRISYKIYLPASILKKIVKFDKYRKSSSIVCLYLLRQLIKKEGNLDIKAILTKFVKDYCGPSWMVDVSLYCESEYREPETETAEPAT